jgi:hypothetical protein
MPENGTRAGTAVEADAANGAADCGLRLCAVWATHGWNAVETSAAAARARESLRELMRFLLKEVHFL